MKYVCRSIFIVLGVFVCLDADAAIYYVSPAGDNSSSGTINEPWRTIQYAAYNAVAGDKVLVRGGTYNESVYVENSGSATGGYIVFKSYPTETAIIDGTGLGIPYGENGLFQVENKDYIRISGFKLTNYQSTDSSSPLGILVTGAGTNIELLNNEISYIETLGDSCDANALGIAIYGRASPDALENITIAENNIHHLKTGCSEAVSVNGNVNGFEVHDNVIHDNNNIGIDVIGYESMAPSEQYDYARNGTVDGNTVFNISTFNNPAYSEYSAAGIYVDGGSNVVVSRNSTYQNDIGIELASEHQDKFTSAVTVRNNLIYRNNVAGVSIGGYSPEVGGTSECQIVNNTLFKNDVERTFGGELQIMYNAQNNLFENNVVYANSQMVFVNYYVASNNNPATINHNLYYGPDPASTSEWAWLGNNYVGFSAYISQTGNDQASAYANPDLAQTTPTYDFRLENGSNAVDVGNNLGTNVIGNTDFYGGPRVNGTRVDIGADEL